MSRWRLVRTAPAGARLYAALVIRPYREIGMALTDPDGDGTIEECIEELEELVARLERYAPQVLAAAMATHLEALLHALRAEGACSAAEVRELLREIETGALE
jgi:hypothetical protein